MAPDLGRQRVPLPKGFPVMERLWHKPQVSDPFIQVIKGIKFKMAKCLTEEKYFVNIVTSCIENSKFMTKYIALNQIVTT